nr:hypothetical protein [Tanacetum cinerariifolium]
DKSDVVDNTSSLSQVKDGETATEIVGAGSDKIADAVFTALKVCA